MLKNRVSAIVCLLLAAFFSVIYMTTPTGLFSQSLFSISMIAVVIGVVLFFVCSQNSLLKDYWIKPSNLFLISFMAVNFQYLIDYRLGLKNDLSSHILYPGCLNLCLLLGVVGLLAFVSGYAWLFRSETPRHFSASYQKKSYSLEGIKWPLVFCHLALFVAFLVTVDISSFISGMNYGAEEKSKSSFEGLLYATNVLVVLFAIKNKNNDGSFKKYLQSFPKLSLVVICLYMVIRLLSGDRGPCIYTGLLVFYGYAFLSRKKFKLGVVVLTLFFAAGLTSIIGIARTLDRGNGFFSRIGSAKEMYQSSGRFKEETSISPATDELGFSFLVNQIDVNQVEVRGAPLNYGTYTVYSFIHGIPFGPRFLSRTLGVKPEEFTSAGFANYYFFGGYERNWGIGTTIVGDFFLQLGVIGVLIGLFITGLLLRWLDWILFVRRKDSIGIYLLLLAILFASKEIYMPRAVLLTDWPNYVHCSIILFVLSFIFIPKRH